MINKNLLLLIFLFFLVVVKNSFAQDSFNTQLLFETTQTDGDFVDVIVEDNYIYAIVGNNLKVYEISDQSFLNYISQTSLYDSTSSPSKLLKNGNKIVVLFSSKTFPDNNPGGIKIFEVDAEHKIKFLSIYDISGFKHDFALTNKYIFVAAGESGLFIIDYQNPVSPFTIGRYNPGGYSIGNGIINVSVNGNIASVSMFSEGLDVIDITNISQPKKLFSLLEYGDNVNTGFLSENFLYVFLQNSAMCKIYNISNRQNIQLLSSLSISQSVSDVSILGDYLFVSGNGTQIINISDQTNPFHVGFTNTSESNSTHYVNIDKIFTTSFLYDSGSYIHKLAIYSFSNLNSKITLIEPTNNITWISGENQSIDISAYNINSIDLEISPDAGSTWTKVLSDYSISGGNEKIYFVVPKFNSSECLLKISDSNNKNVFDISSNKFTIFYNLQIDSPKEGTYYNEVNIVWSSQDLDRFSLHYSIDNSPNWDVIVEDYVDSSDYWKHYNWQFQNLNAENVKIKVSSYFDANIFDISQDVTLKSRVEIGDSTFDSPSTFYPLQVGNIWQYRVSLNTDYGLVNKGYDFMKVLSDTTIGDNKYFKVETVGWSDTINYQRYDSLQSSIVRYLGNEEAISFKLNSIKNECWDFEFTGKEICNSGTYLESIFGIEKPVIYFSQSGFNSQYFHLAKDLGPIWIMNDQSYINTDIWNYDLVYAKINGIEYGTYVSVNEDDTAQPKDFYLFQNYPNPFNPTTKIQYSIPSSNTPLLRGVGGVFVTLKVYDILGKEVATLVNKEQSTGSYEVEFRSDGLPSGVYFYRLQTGNYSKVKKMVLLK